MATTNNATAPAGPNVYTALLAIACLVLIGTTVFLVMHLTDDPASGGYGMNFADLFTPWKASQSAGM